MPARTEKIAALEASQEHDVSRLTLDIAYDRQQRISRLEKIEPQPLQKDQADILKALLTTNGGKMLEKQARLKMRMSKQSLTNLLAVIDGIESRPYRTDKRQRLLVLE